MFGPEELPFVDALPVGPGAVRTVGAVREVGAVGAVVGLGFVAAVPLPTGVVGVVWVVVEVVPWGVGFVGVLLVPTGVVGTPEFVGVVGVV